MPTEPALRQGPIGLLYPGEMGTAVARLLLGAGLRVVTSLEGRGAATVRNSLSAGVEDLQSLGEVVRTASVLLVLVPPDAAVEVAAQVRDQLHLRRQAGRLVYVDLNSISPATVAAVAEQLAGEAYFVDGAISGPASRLAERCVLYLSGAQAHEVAELFAGRLRVQVLGERLGQASALRMLLSGLTKGVIALFVEMAVAGQQAGVLDRLLAAYRTSYPGIMEVVDRTLPSYPQHAARRGQEMAEVEKTLSGLGLCPTVVSAVRELTAAVAHCLHEADRECVWGVADLIEELNARGLLHRDA